MQCYPKTATCHLCSGAFEIGVTLSLWHCYEPIEPTVTVSPIVCWKCVKVCIFFKCNQIWHTSWAEVLRHLPWRLITLDTWRVSTSNPASTLRTSPGSTSTLDWDDWDDQVIEAAFEQRISSVRLTPDPLFNWRPTTFHLNASGF